MSDREPDVRPLLPVDPNEGGLDEGRLVPVAEARVDSPPPPSSAPRGPATGKGERVWLAAALAVLLSASSIAAIGGLVMISVDALDPSVPPPAGRARLVVEQAAPILVPPGKADERRPRSRTEGPTEQAAAVASGEVAVGRDETQESSGDQGGGSGGTTVPPVPAPQPSPTLEEEDEDAPGPVPTPPGHREDGRPGLGLGHIKAKGQGHHKEHGHGHEQDPG